MSFSSCAFRDSLEACGDGSLGRLQIYKGLLFVKIGAEGRLFTTENAADAAVFRLLRQGPAEIMLQEVTTGMVVSIDDYDDLNGQISLRSILEPSKQRLLVTVQELAEKQVAWLLEFRRDSVSCGFMSPRLLEAGLPLLRRACAEAAGWEGFVFRLSEIPIVNVSPLVKFSEAHDISLVNCLSELPTDCQIVLARLAKAARDIGFYLIIGHGLCLDVLSLVKAQAAGMVPADDRVENVALWERYGMSASWPSWSADKSFFTGHVARLPKPLPGRQSFLPEDTPVDLIAKYAAEALGLEVLLLHSLALCQQAVTGAADWRFMAAPRPCAEGGPGRLVHGGAVAVRALRYPPGPVGSCGMGRHRDATWLTLLAQDEIGGLRVLLHDGDSPVMVPSFPGALVVNAGMALHEFSGGFFQAVCHEVVRVNDRLPRVSVVLFYDASDKSRTVGGCPAV